jgi:histone H3/H4
LGERAFSLYDVEQFIREAGAEKVTEDAVLNLERELEKLTEALANKAIRYAAHAGRRKLIKKNDVLLTMGSDYKRAYALRRKANNTNANSIKHR